jgi:transposase-like protein
MTTAQQTERPTTSPVDTEVRPSKRPARSAAERLRIVEEYDSYPAGSPERGALLRREGVYSSAISKWRKLCRQGALSALATQPPGPKSAPRDPRQDELAQLRAENARLQARLAQVELVLDMQKKVAALLGASTPPTLLDEHA